MINLLRFALLMAPLFAAAQPVDTTQFPARTRLITYQSLTLTDRQFLTGDARGTPVTIAGQLRIAQGEGRMPTVILIHGSAGMGSNLEVWSQELNRLGVSTFAIDGLTGRGLSNVAPDQSLLGRLNFILDAYGALEVLAAHPRVDPGRVAIMGFSRGGQATLYASLKRFNEVWNRSGIDMAAYIPFYPNCATTYQSDTEVVDAPIRIFHGAADEINPVGPCKSFVERLNEAGRDAQLTEYPGAHHAFDFPSASEIPTATNFESGAACTIREESDA
jgi:dienelactone hydrolase